MKKLILIILLALMLANTGIAFAFNTYEPGVLIDTETVGTSPNDGVTENAIVYIGENTDGNHMVMTAHLIHTGEVGPYDPVTIINTFEINSSGEIVRLIDSGTISDAWTDHYSFIEITEGSKYWLVATGGVYPILVSSDGAIDLSEGKTTISGYALDSLKVFNGVIILSSTAKHKTFNTVPNGINEYTVQADGYDYSLMDNYSSGNNAYYFVTQYGALCTYPHSWLVNKVYSDGELQDSWAGTLPFTYISKSSTSDNGQTIWLTDNVYMTLSKAFAAEGHNGTIDVGVETFKVDNINYVSGTYTAVTLVNAGTAWVSDTDNAVTGAIRMSDGNAVLLYLDKLTSDYKLKMKTLRNVQSDGILSQDQISQELIIFNPPVGQNYIGIDSYGNSSCRIGDSHYIAIIASSTFVNTEYLFTVEVYLPPVVDTVSVIPLMTAYNTLYDGAIRAYGEVEDIGSSPVTEWGFRYNTTGYPDYSDAGVSFTGTESSPFEFDEDILDLLTSDLYYVRAYACNASGTGYGDIIESYTFPEYPNTILKLDFEPLEISSGTISDQSGYGHDVSFVLAPNPGSISITIGDIVAANAYEYECSGTDCESFFTPQFVPPPGWVLESGSRVFPFDPPTQDTVPTRLWWLSGLTVLMVVAGIFCYKYTRVLLGTAVIGLIIILWACSMHWMGWWVFAMCVILTPGLLLKAESQHPF